MRDRERGRWGEGGKSRGTIRGKEKNMRKIEGDGWGIGMDGV